MGLLQKFDPPAFLGDFKDLPGLADQWHNAMSNWFDYVVELEARGLPDGAAAQYYNPTKFDPGFPLIDQAITWNAFPKELLRQYGLERALRNADSLWPLSKYSPRFRGENFDVTYYRPLNEYCEWHVSRDPYTGKVVKVIFSSEPPEYWKALYGGTYTLDDGKTYKFSGNPQKVLELYRDLVSPEVQQEDLICQNEIGSDATQVHVRKGEYNPYNKWNTTHGIAHLCAPPNSLIAEIELGGDATILRNDRRGRLVVEPDSLICCAAYGGPDRNSDPTIGASVNALARLGAYITLRNPVGLYMDHIDVAGWSAPDGVDISDCVRIVRGSPGMIERLQVEVPPGSGYQLGDLKIGGVPVQYGGQIAECITVKLVGTAVLANLKPTPVPCVARCCIDLNHPTVLDRAVLNEEPVPPGKQPAFVNEGSTPSPDAETSSLIPAFGTELQPEQGEAVSQKVKPRRLSHRAP
jgi:hypothetical protein